MHRQEKKEIMVNWTSLNLNSCILNDTIKKLKRQSSEWERIFVNNISDKNLVFKIYKNSLQQKDKEPS